MTNILKGIRITIDSEGVFIATRNQTKTGYKPDSLFKEKEKAIKRIADLLGLKVEIVKESS